MKRDLNTEMETMTYPSLRMSLHQIKLIKIDLCLLLLYTFNTTHFNYDINTLHVFYSCCGSLEVLSRICEEGELIMVDTF